VLVILLNGTSAATPSAGSSDSSERFPLTWIFVKSPEFVRPAHQAGREAWAEPGTKTVQQHPSECDRSFTERTVVPRLSHPARGPPTRFCMSGKRPGQTRHRGGASWWA
jgi:hypothetical protein